MSGYPETDKLQGKSNLPRVKINNRELMESLRYAGLIQKALLPSDCHKKKLLKDYFILFMPKSIVSGDFYWLTQKERQTCVVAADCTGHGIPGALMSILGITILNEVIRNDCTNLASRILNKLREKIMEALDQTGDFNESKDGIDLSICILNNERTSLQYAGANNPLYIVRNNHLTEIKPDKMPVGINALQEEPFSNHHIELEKNDMIYMFSDGFPDQFGGPRGKKFKYRPFKKLLVDINQEKMDKQKEILQDTLSNWMGKNEQVDDILIIGYRIT